MEANRRSFFKKAALLACGVFIPMEASAKKTQATTTKLNDGNRYVRMILKPGNFKYNRLPMLTPQDLGTIDADLTFCSFENYQALVGKYLNDIVFPSFIAWKAEPYGLSELPVPLWMIDKNLDYDEYYILFANYAGSKKVMFHCEGA